MTSKAALQIHKTFSVGPKSGSHVTVYKRSGEGIILDLNYFENQRSLEEARDLIRVLQEAVDFAVEAERRARTTL